MSIFDHCASWSLGLNAFTVIGIGFFLRRITDALNATKEAHARTHLQSQVALGIKMLERASWLTVVGAALNAVARGYPGLGRLTKPLSIVYMASTVALLTDSVQIPHFVPK